MHLSHILVPLVIISRHVPPVFRFHTIFTARLNAYSIDLAECLPLSFLCRLFPAFFSGLVSTAGEAFK